MKRPCLTICLILACGFLSHQGCDKGIAGEPPKITNLQDGDTLVADNCNKLSFQFEADPGGVCGTEQIISWNVVTGLGVVDNEGLFTFYQPNIGVYPMVVELFNDCVPSLRDEISFYVSAETETYTAKDADSWLRNKLNPERRFYVYGPEGAESVSVRIETNGTTDDMEAMGIEFRPASRKNIYYARMSIDEFTHVKKLPSVIRVSLEDITVEEFSLFSPAPHTGGGNANADAAQPPSMTTPTLAISGTRPEAESGGSLNRVESRTAEGKRYDVICGPPLITNLKDGDTLVADNCNKLSFQFEADPGGAGGNGQITDWNVLAGSQGGINFGLSSKKIMG